MDENQKPSRLLFKSYIQAIHNAVGSKLFRNLYVHNAARGDFNAMDDGENSCAFFVSAILLLFDKIDHVHGTVGGTIKALREASWAEVDNAQTGDVLVWEAKSYRDGVHEHIGFYAGNNRAISNSATHKTPVEHDMYFGKEQRKITTIFRLSNWENRA